MCVKQISVADSLKCCNSSFLFPKVLKYQCENWRTVLGMGPGTPTCPSPTTTGSTRTWGWRTTRTSSGRRRPRWWTRRRWRSWGTCWRRPTASTRRWSKHTDQSPVGRGDRNPNTTSIFDPNCIMIDFRSNPRHGHLLGDVPQTCWQVRTENSRLHTIICCVSATQHSLADSWMSKYFVFIPTENILKLAIPIAATLLESNTYWTLNWNELQMKPVVLTIMWSSVKFSLSYPCWPTVTIR